MRQNSEIKLSSFHLNCVWKGSHQDVFIYTLHIIYAFIVLQKAREVAKGKKYAIGFDNGRVLRYRYANDRPGKQV